MSNIIKPKRSNTAGLTPTTSNLSSGELGVNMADQKVYINNGTSVVQIGAGNLSGLDDVNISTPTSGQSLQYNGTEWVNSAGGTGDVVGASSSTDNALVRFDGTTGKLIQNGVVTQDDNGTLANVNAITLDTTPTSVPTTQGTMFWDSGNGTPSIVLNADVDLQVGQEMLALVYNGSGSTITNGSVVAVSGAQGQRPSVVLADADSESLSAPTLGIATEDIANGAEGFVTTFGFVRGLNTSAFTAGLPIYLSQTAGQFTQTRPSAPAHTVALGWVIKVNASSGEVFVNINNGWELDELHNVLITSPTSGNTLIYDAVAGVWENANISAGTGISVTNGAGSITIANTGVTSVSGTAPIASSGGATPTISISQASSTTNGYLSSTDWNTFNNKTSNTGTVTSVSATVPTGLSISGSPITTSGTLAITYTAGYSIPTTASQTNWDTAYSDRLKWDGGSTGLTPSTGRTSLGGTTVGQNFFTLTNPTAVTFPRINADNTVSALDASTFRSAIGAGTGSGTVTSVSGTGTVSGITLSGSVTSSGSLTLGGTFSSTISGISDAYRWWNNFGDNHSTRTSFDAQGSASSVNFGYRYVQGNTNAPNVGNTGIGQYYSWFIGLGNDYAYNQYGAQFAIPRNATTPYLSVRFEEGGSFGAWQKMSAGYADSAGSVTNSLTAGTGLSGTAFNGSSAQTWSLATSGVSANTYGSSTAIPVITVDTYGRITSASTATVSGGQYFGTATTKAIAYNANSISENITVTAGNNGLSAGPITINTGYTVTVQTGANWVIV